LSSQTTHPAPPPTAQQPRGVSAANFLERAGEKPG
jgi:hypothetical protein